MEILPGIEMVDLALWLKKDKTLILSDFHLGYEDMLKSKGCFVPTFQFKDILLKLNTILNKVKPKIIVLNGDLKHEFGKILNQEWKEVLALIDFLSNHCSELIIIKGNHDLFLGPIVSKRKVRIVPNYLIKDILISHGNQLVNTPARTLIIGHEHPAITLRLGAKKEKYKCFLKGFWKQKIILVMPSFNPLFEGTDILQRKKLSPYLAQNLSNFEVFVVGQKIYSFGKIQNLS